MRKHLQKEKLIRGLREKILKKKMYKVFLQTKIFYYLLTRKINKSVAKRTYYNYTHKIILSFFFSVGSIIDAKRI